LFQKHLQFCVTLHKICVTLLQRHTCGPDGIALQYHSVAIQVH